MYKHISGSISMVMFCTLEVYSGYPRFTMLYKPREEGGILIYRFTPNPHIHWESRVLRAFPCPFH